MQKKNHAARKFSIRPIETALPGKGKWVKNYQYACLMLFSLLFLFIINRGWINGLKGKATFIFGTKVTKFDVIFWLCFV